MHSHSIDLESSSERDTRAIGAALAGLLEPGDVVGLTGDLGAGKTRLVQGAVAALGADDPVVSPTFMLVREYDGDLAVNHVDAYRLSGPAELAPPAPPPQPPAQPVPYIDVTDGAPPAGADTQPDPDHESEQLGLF